MSASLIQYIKDEIESALGDHFKYFDIETGEILSDDPEDFSMTISIEPRKIHIPDGEVIGGKYYHQFNIDDEGNISMIFGEDTEIQVTAENIYSALYWCEATKAV